MALDKSCAKALCNINFKSKEKKMATYTCKYCGFQTTNSHLIQNCRISETKSHVWMNATEKLSSYICKYCGHKSSNSYLVQNCQKNPTKTHEWLG